MGGVAGARAVATRGARDRRHQPVGGDAVRGRPAAVRQARPAGRRVRHALDLRHVAAAAAPAALAEPHLRGRERRGGRARARPRLVRAAARVGPRRRPRHPGRRRHLGRVHVGRTDARRQLLDAVARRRPAAPPVARALPPPVEPRPHGVEVGAAPRRAAQRRRARRRPRARGCKRTWQRRPDRRGRRRPAGVAARARRHEGAQRADPRVQVGVGEDQVGQAARRGQLHDGGDDGAPQVVEPRLPAARAAGAAARRG